MNTCFEETVTQYQRRRAEDRRMVFTLEVWGRRFSPGTLLAGRLDDLDGFVRFRGVSLEVRNTEMSSGLEFIQ